MCGIVGYTGKRPAQGILIQGLTRLEYRGYDSAGIAVQEDDSLAVIHRKGKVASLEHTLSHFDFQGTCGIGHTRWATHGKPSEANAHPHTSCGGHIAVVHNGIIENFAELREELEGLGHVFTSETDTEVVAHLLEEAYQGDLVAALRDACSRIVGAYGLAAICDMEPGVIAVTRKDSPIVIGQGEDGAYVASDMIAMIDATRDVVILGDGEYARMTASGIEYTDEAGRAIEPRITHVDWDLDLAEKGGYPDFMLKEIHEQPRVVRGLSFRYRWMSPMTARRGQYRTPFFAEKRPPLYCIAADTGSFCFLILLFCSVVMKILLSLHLRFLRPTPKSFRSHFPPFLRSYFYLWVGQQARRVPQARFLTAKIRFDSLRTAFCRG